MAGVYPEPTVYNRVFAGQKTVTTSGTAVALSTFATIHAVIVRAHPGNSGKIVVGPSGTLYASNNGYVLQPGDAVSFPVTDPSLVFLDCQTNGDGVSWLAT